MDAYLKPAVRLRPRGFSVRGEAVATGVLVTCVVVAGFALLIIVRRLAGALERPAPAAILLGSAAVIATLAYLGRRLWRMTRSQHSADAAGAWPDALVAWGPSLCLLLLAVGLSWPLGRGMDWLIWAPLWIADFAWRRKLMTDLPRQRENDMLRSARADSNHGTGAGVDSDKHAAGPDEHVVLQRITRFRDPPGRDCLSGSLHAEIAPGERSTHLYVSFCPPFEATPTIEVEQSDGPPARIAVGLVRPHGARIDVRLASAADSSSQVAVELFGTCPEPRCTSISAAV